ncbi:hypothetical protein [Mycobacterium sp. AZCC_0083]|nr:hypothetical protein [Mycobacterium sp. AZCC_0083]MBB5167112.1 hypothetical protein [Mycobacterium sp. AZCC_0083]
MNDTDNHDDAIEIVAVVLENCIPGCNDLAANAVATEIVSALVKADRL